MQKKRKMVELDETTAETLVSRAAVRGVTISELVSELLDHDSRAEEIAELDRRWAAIEAGAKTIPNEDVVRWLQTWGTPAYRPWSNK